MKPKQDETVGAQVTPQLIRLEQSLRFFLAVFAAAQCKTLMMFLTR